MARKYRTTKVHNIPSVKKVGEIMKQKRRDAMKIIKKSQSFDVEIRLLILTLILIVLMFAILPFLIYMKNKRGDRKAKQKGGGMSLPTYGSGINAKHEHESENMMMSNSVAPKDNIILTGMNSSILNDAGNILNDVSHSELFNDVNNNGGGNEGGNSGGSTEIKNNIGGNGITLSI